MPPLAPVRARERRDISWMGLAGGLAGVLLLGQSAVIILVSPGDASRWAAVLFFAIGVVYLPAIWVSLFATPQRRPVLRWVVAITLVFVMFAVLFLDPAFASLMLVPSTLLAIAGGLVFQGKGSR
ncbi:MAG: hypothetical protein ACRDH5_09085 [bacterium]